MEKRPEAPRFRVVKRGDLHRRPALGDPVPGPSYNSRHGGPGRAVTVLVSLSNDELVDTAVGSSAMDVDPGPTVPPPRRAIVVGNPAGEKGKPRGGVKGGSAARGRERWPSALRKGDVSLSGNEPGRETKSQWPPLSPQRLLFRGESRLHLPEAGDGSFDLPEAAGKPLLGTRWNR